MDAAALAISICAFLLSAAAFGWTIYEWRRSGVRLKVEVTSFAALGRMTMTGQTKDPWTIAFDVSNAGRTPTTVTTVGFRRPKGRGALVFSDPAVGPNPLPARLGPGDSFTYAVDVAEFLAGCAKQGVPHESLLPYADSAHGAFDGKWRKVALDAVRARRRAQVQSGTER